MASREQLHAIASALPDVEITDVPEDWPAPSPRPARGGPSYRVGGRPFVRFREARPDALDEAGERLTDVVLLWVAGEDDKRALVDDPASPYFTTPHFDGHASVLLRERDLGGLGTDELTEIVQEAWLTRAPARLRRAWLAERGLD